MEKKKSKPEIDERAVKVDIECLEKGAVAATDIYNSYGTVIVRKNRVIEGKHILQMRMSNVREIDIVPLEKMEIPKKLTVNNYPGHLDKLKNTRVLIVDDSKSACILMKTIIEEAGLEVAGTAENNHDALRLVKELKPTCVTLDISMPGEDGIHIIGPILSENPETKIIMVSSLSYEDVIVESLEKGAVQFISKPFDHEEFKRVLIETIIK